ncbi:MAG TPA: Gmad2 immunoglobulin-like domain-containing protein [Candidatus Paceibacterota bacterium]
MKRNSLFLVEVVGFLLLLVSIGVYFLTKEKSSPQVMVVTFAECVAAGNSVMESYPRQCASKDGQHFTEDLGNTVEKENLIRLASPRPNDVVESPLKLTGEARGNWYFEASFPVYLTDWDGKIIAQGIATAQSEWMTTEFVPFEATLTFNTAEISGQYSKRGTLILRKDNPSGLPEHDDALEIPVQLK